MKKLLLLLAVTICCYFQANAGFSIGAKLKDPKSYQDIASYKDIKFDFYHINYDHFISNYYLSVQLELDNRLQGPIDYSGVSGKFGYEVANDIVLFCSLTKAQYKINQSLELDNYHEIKVATGVQKYFKQFIIGVQYQGVKNVDDSFTFKEFANYSINSFQWGWDWYFAYRL